MIELLQGQAADQADRTAYAFLDDRDGVTEISRSASSTAGPA